MITTGLTLRGLGDRGRILSTRHHIPCLSRRPFLTIYPPQNGNKMSYKERRLLGYSQQQMWDIASDVSSYPEFVPWCSRAAVVKKNPDGSFICRLGVGFPPFSDSYLSTVTVINPTFVKSVAQECHLFHYLINQWDFLPGLKENPNTCKLEFSVDFEFKSVLYSKVAGLFFDQVVSIMASVVNTANVLAQRIGRLLIIGLNRPHKSNTVDRATANELYGVIRNDFEKNDEIYGGVLYGEGKDFCTGLDLEELSESGTKCLTEQAECAPMGPTRMCLTKPLIAAITGRAIGGGLELALMCDLRIAEQDSMLGLHPRKYGIPMMDLGTVRLPALIGLSRALDLTLTGRHLSAAEAFQFGLVNQIAKAGTAVGLAVKLMDDLCRSYGRHALLADRKSMLNAAGLWSSEGRTLEWQRKEFTSAIEALRRDGFVGIKTFVKEKTEGIKR
ncbi:unnamed protein product [Calicophoron daubneyi]|uniref:Coenzyme Q-binding protein COQ10 START domain-containing protein n=1 Tax=Calicophoron daubneyi TaxID=300641 RepID=A0AAV2TXJ8_CALDB